MDIIRNKEREEGMKAGGEQKGVFFNFRKNGDEIIWKLECWPEATVEILETVKEEVEKEIANKIRNKVN